MYLTVLLNTPFKSILKALMQNFLALLYTFIWFNFHKEITLSLPFRTSCVFAFERSRERIVDIESDRLRLPE
jgi:hypothetical protein